MQTPTPTLDYQMKDHWTPQERDNVETAAEFVQMLMIDHDFDAFRARFGSSPYVQHSRGIPEGIDGLVDYVSTLAGRFPEYAYDVKNVLVDGDHVTFQSHATIRAKHRGDERKGFNIIDTWRVVDGQIVEHWDAIQPLGLSMRLLVLFVGGRTRNTNSIF